jgi:hypothetical protein
VTIYNWDKINNKASLQTELGYLGNITL